MGDISAPQEAIDANTNHPLISLTIYIFVIIQDKKLLKINKELRRKTHQWIVDILDRPFDPSKNRSCRGQLKNKSQGKLQSTIH